jgi:divalent metal cation (Fe/Co/Zn/Cd) transporter
MLRSAGVGPVHPDRTIRREARPDPTGVPARTVDNWLDERRGHRRHWRWPDGRELVLTAFGLDSLIELASAGVLIWRLTVELRRGERFSEEIERTASRIAGALLLVLAAYVTVAAAWSLWTRTGEAFSWPGLIVALVAIPSMRYLAHRKIAIAEKLGSRALRADAMEAVTCGWLSFVVVVSLAAQWALGAW